MAQAKKPEAPTFNISILGIKEGHEWCAIALEMDLRGYGETFDLAMADLKDQVVMQISFCLQNGTPESIYHPAEQEYWDKYQAGKREQMLASVTHQRPVGRTSIARDIPFNQRLIEGGREHRFELAHA